MKSNFAEGSIDQVLFQQQALFIGNFALNAQTNLLKFAHEKPRQITPRECDVLKLLCQNVDKVVTRKRILKTYWNDTSGYASRSLDLIIHRLRKHLILDPKVKIYTIRSKGFILTANSLPE
ncbi:MAG: winged helix-turn-helix domain-containing protein [Candidatus Symbiothrix sp.]|jgi:DNA-binding response OmpR family regulator|nr:winged helix-turn-helix domain-containing protein [Candidatus Symbiothrix sp.]